MTGILWIAIGAAVLVIAAHILLFWFFLMRKPKSSGNKAKPDENDDHTPSPD